MRRLPPLILLPGTLCDERLWVDVLPQLNGLTDCQTVTWGSAECSVSAAAERILREAPPSFAIAGMSMGGSVALELCAQAPHRVEALALISCQPRGDSKEGADARSTFLSYAAEFGMSALIRERLWPNYVHSTRLSDQALLDAVCAMAERAGILSYQSQHRLLASRRDHSATLASLQVPVAIVSGDSDLLCTPAQQVEMLTMSRFARSTEIKKCGHLSPLEDPGSVSTALCSWLNAI